MSVSNHRVLDHLQKVPTTINQDLVFVGNLEGSDNFIVRGKVVGNSDVEGAIMLGEGSNWRGDIVADVIVLRGTVEGNVTARQKLEVRHTARVQGNLTAPIIAIATGATVLGKISQDSLITHFSERRAR